METATEIPEIAVLLLLEFRLVACLQRVDSNFDLANVAIRKVAGASAVRRIFAGSELSSFDSRWSLRMPILVGSSAAIRRDRKKVTSDG